MKANRKGLEMIFKKHGFTDFKWLDPQKIVVSQWVRMKCLYGCPHYGAAGCCPPNVPTVSECREFLREYSTAVVFHFSEKMKNPEDRHGWTKKINARLLKAERDVFLVGNQRAFLLYMDTCQACAECTPTRSGCNNKKAARPVPEALAIDVFSTARSIGYPIDVLSDFSLRMNRYAFLLIE